MVWQEHGGLSVGLQSMIGGMCSNATSGSCIWPKEHVVAARLAMNSITHGALAETTAGA